MCTMTTTAGNVQAPEMSTFGVKADIGAIVICGVFLHLTVEEGDFSRTYRLALRAPQSYWHSVTALAM